MSFEINKKIQEQQTSKPNTTEGITEAELNQKLGNKLQKEVNDIFTQFNTNQTANAKNQQVLDRNEQVSLMAYLKQLAGEDESITKKEYKNAKNSGTTVGSNVSYKDLKKIASTLDEIIGQAGTSITYGAAEDGISITANGSQYTVQNNEDGIASSVSQEVTDTGEIKTYDYENGYLASITGNLSGIRNTYDLNGETVLKKETTDDEGNVTSSETYENDSGGNISSTTKVSGAVTEILDSQGRITKKTINLGQGLTDTTTYEYNSDGTVTETNINELAGATTVTVTKNGTAVKETLTIEKGTVTETMYDESGKPSSQTITGSDGSVNETTYNQDGGKTVNYTSGDYNSETEYNSNGKRTAQTATVDGQEYTVEYDGDGNTKGVIVQNGESPAVIAEKFGCSVEDLKNANKDILKGKAPNQYFVAGAEIKIPKEINADEFAQLQAGRKSSEEAKADYAQMMEERAAREAEEKAAREAEEETARRAEEEYNNGTVKRQEAEALSKKFYKFADDHQGRVSTSQMSLMFTKGEINKDNIVEFLDAYELDSEIQEHDKSAIETITDEWSAHNSQLAKVLTKVLETLCEAAKEAGVSDVDIEKAKTDFNKSLEKEYGLGAEPRRANPKDMEEAIDFLRGAIKAKQTANVEEMSDSTAISSFNESFGAENEKAQSAYNEAKGDGWSRSARLGDTVCGWFGCNTIEEMEAKLGDNAKAVKELANAKTEEEFKSKYKEVFGIDFDPQKIAAAEAAESVYTVAAGYSQTVTTCDNLLKKSANSDLATLESDFRKAWQSTGKDESQISARNKEIDEILNQIYSSCSSDDDKKQALVEFLQTSKDNALSEFRSLSKGRTLEQMNKDAKLIRQSAFGTNDIGKDVAQFTENMATTEMVTEIAGDVAFTVLLTAVPGTAALGAAKMAATAAKWGTRGVKVAKALDKTAMAMDTVKKVESGTKFTSKAANLTTKTISGSANAAGGTLANSKWMTDRSKEEVIEMCRQNGLFGAIGVGASELAPKIIQLCKCSSKVANEVAEELLNQGGYTATNSVQGNNVTGVDILSNASTTVSSRKANVILNRLTHR